MDGWHRGGLLLALLLALAASLVAFGAVAPDPSANTFPGNDEVVADPAAHVNERVVVGGTVVGTDPVVVRLENGVGVHEVTVTGLDRTDVSTGDRLSAFGSLSGTDAVEAERSIVRAPWELAYMYGVSFLGGLVVLGRLGLGWRVDGERWVLVPRAAKPSPGGESSHAEAGGGGGDA